MTLGSLARAALRQGDFPQARALLSESLSLRREIGDKGGIAWCLEREAEMAADEGKAERAVRLCGAAASLRASVGSAIDPADQPEQRRVVLSSGEGLCLSERGGSYDGRTSLAEYSAL